MVEGYSNHSDSIEAHTTHSHIHVVVVLEVRKDSLHRSIHFGEPRNLVGPFPVGVVQSAHLLHRLVEVLHVHNLGKVRVRNFEVVHKVVEVHHIGRHVEVVRDVGRHMVEPFHNH